MYLFILKPDITIKTFWKLSVLLLFREMHLRLSTSWVSCFSLSFNLHYLDGLPIHKSTSIVQLIRFQLNIYMFYNFKLHCSYFVRKHKCSGQIYVAKTICINFFVLFLHKTHAKNNKCLLTLALATEIPHKLD